MTTNRKNDMIADKVNLDSAREYLASAQRWLQEAASLIRETSETDRIVDTKSNRNDLVTNVDREVEKLIVTRVSEEYGHPVLGEEGDRVSSMKGPVWILDPIDGTMNFVQAKRDFAIELALFWDGKPVIGLVFDVGRDELYTAISGHGAWVNGVEIPKVEDDRSRKDILYVAELRELEAVPRFVELVDESRGLRCYGAAAIDLIQVASGRAGACLLLWLHSWDFAGAMVICQEVGLAFTRMDGTRINVEETGTVLTAPPSIHRDIVRFLHREYRLISPSR
ncbi:inositol monophosphatase family protein [Actinomycetaceae bacterium L2_0104]